MKMVKVLTIIFSLFLVVGCNNEEILVSDNNSIKEIVEQEDINTGYIKDTIDIKKVDNNYEFYYNGETFKVVFVNDTWKIYDSYKITNSSDIKKICKALLDIHKIPSSDYKSYRTESDMAYEWKQHNLAYQILPEGNSFRESAKDVDLDPRDQGKSLVEIYEDRTGQKLDLGKFFK